MCNIREKCFTICFLTELFKGIDDSTVFDFIKEIHCICINAVQYLCHNGIRPTFHFTTFLILTEFIVIHPTFSCH